MGIHRLRTEEPHAPAPQLSPARERLRQAITALDQAQCEAEAGTRPLRRLEQVTAEGEQLERELASFRCQDEVELGRWIAEGSIGARPQPSAATVAAQVRLVDLAADLRGVAAALPAAQAVHQASVASVTAAATERALALSLVAIEAAESVAAELTAQLNVALSLEARLHGLVAALGANPTNGCGGAAEKIDGLIRAAKSAAGVPRDTDAGRKLLDALAHNPSAEL